MFHDEAATRTANGPTVGSTRNFGYDDLQRLVSGGTAASPESYAYDPKGNRTTSHLSSLHVVDDANRLTEDDDYTFSYDANSNLETKRGGLSSLDSFG